MTGRHMVRPSDPALNEARDATQSSVAMHDTAARQDPAWESNRSNKRRRLSFTRSSRRVSADVKRATRCSESDVVYLRIIGHQKTEAVKKRRSDSDVAYMTTRPKEQ